MTLVPDVNDPAVPYSPVSRAVPPPHAWTPLTAVAQGLGWLFGYAFALAHAALHALPGAGRQVAEGFKASAQSIAKELRDSGAPKPRAKDVCVTPGGLEKLSRMRKAG